MFKQLSCPEADELINGGGLVIADVRDIDSYNDAHIHSAIHLSMPMLQDFCETADKNQPILVYCYHGITSQSVAQHLIEQGFSQVYSLVGGFETWKEHHPTSDES
ncbi:MAG: thiosulfate sulfurtransferase GlpE [Coxiella sp. (in: Bacteria)]|nr:MAG: thiosulfate sulfurtransferase GlpE [Coxiella sp. (in: g-proteobacteria)]